MCANDKMNIKLNMHQGNNTNRSGLQIYFIRILFVPIVSILETLTNNFGTYANTQLGIRIFKSLAMCALGIFIVRNIESTALPAKWILIPITWIALTLIPIYFNSALINSLGLSSEKTVENRKYIVLCMIFLFPITYLSVLTMDQLGLPLPNLSQINLHHMILWALYQLCYVAVCEEFFFRGYLASILLPCKKHPISNKNWRLNIIYILVSSLLFAVSHIVISESLAGILTFIPGVALAYIFIRTQSIFVTIILHAGANIFYVLSTLLIAR